MRFHSILLLVLGLAGSTVMAADDWPQFRGPDGQGHSVEDNAGLPLRWSETENVAWKVAVEGRGWSSPVVLGEQIWLTTSLTTPATPEEAKATLQRVGRSVPSPEVARHITLKAVCIDRASGRTVHSITLFEVDELMTMCGTNSFASPTPVIEAGRLYCDFGTMGTACVATTSGDILWRRHLPAEHQVGPGSSPILDGDRLVLVRDGVDKQYLIAVEKQSGKTVWRTGRPPIKTTAGPLKKAFSTPLVFDSAAGRQMVVPGAQWIVSYDPDSGKPIWRVDTGGTYSNTSRPVFGHGMVFVCTAYGGTKLYAVRVDGRDDVTDTHIAWEQRRQVPKMSSPLLIGDELYTISDAGVATCFDARTGTIHWSKRILGNCSASPVLAAGRIYFCDEDGKTAVLKPSRESTSLAENQLDGQIMASPAIADRAIFLRTDTHLYRLEEK